jgi:hypothetical protein
MFAANFVEWNGISFHASIVSMFKPIRAARIKTPLRIVGINRHRQYDEDTKRITL